jgi:hypothetical protein
MQTISYQDRARLRRNFVPTIVVIILLWITLGKIIISLEPERFVNVFAFLVVFNLATFFSLATILASTRRGFLIATCATIFLIGRYLNISNLQNIAIIIGFLILSRVYLAHKK